MLCITISLLVSCLDAAHADQEGFDAICKIYTEVLNSKMGAREGSQYIYNNIIKRVHDNDALNAHDLLHMVPPEKRYSIFKDSAENSLKRNWDCVAMKKLMRGN